VVCGLAESPTRTQILEAQLNTQPALAGAAILAGLIVGGGAYAARHGVGAPGTDASAAARSGVTRQIPKVPHVRLAEWHPVRLPHTATRVAAPVAVTPAPMATTPAQAPVTRTSPAASGDDSGEGGSDD
jgi:hypothetical protein